MNKQEKMEKTYQLLHKNVKGFIPDVNGDIAAKVGRTIEGVQDFLSAEDRLINLVNAKRATGLKWLAEHMQKAPASAPASAKPGFGESVYGFFHQLSEKPIKAKPADTEKPPGPSTKL